MDLLDLEEYTIISFLRRWCDGDYLRDQLKQELIINLGYVEGNQTYECFKNLCEMIFNHGRRALIRHKTDCNCVGADESCFAQLILRASNNYKEDAILISLLLMPPHLSAETVSLAKKIGTSITNLLNNDQIKILTKNTEKNLAAYIERERKFAEKALKTQVENEKIAADKVLMANIAALDETD